MRKLIYLLLLLPFAVSAQQYTNGAKTGNPFIRNAVTDKYPVTYSALISGGHHSYATLAGRDSLVSYYPGLLRDGMQVYVRGTGLTYRWNFATTQWETIAYGDVTKAYVNTLRDSLNTVLVLKANDSNVLHKTGNETKTGFLNIDRLGLQTPEDNNNSFLKIGNDSKIRDNNIINGLSLSGIADSTKGAMQLGYNSNADINKLSNNGDGLLKWNDNRIIDVSQIGSGLTYTGGVLTATGTGGTVTNVSSANADISVINQTTTPVISLNNVNGITKTYYDPTSSIQTQLNSKAPITGSVNYIQNGTTAQTANYNITGTGTANSFAGNYLDLVNQTSLASAPIGTMRVGVLNNRFGWMGSVSGFQFRREIYTNLAANTSFKLPYLASGTLVDSLTNATSVNLKQSKLLQNYVVGANTIVAAGDSVGGAIGKLQSQINNMPTNYITTNTNQVALTGNKTTFGRWSFGGNDLGSFFTFTTAFNLPEVMLYDRGKFLFDALGSITTTGSNQNIDGVFGMTSNTSRLLITRSASDISNTGGTSISPSSITISQGATTNSTIFTPNSLSFGTALPSFSLGVSGTNQLKLNSDGTLAITTTPATASNATQVLTRNPTTQTIEKVDLTAVLSGDRSPVLVSASITMALNRDYLNTTATQYTLTLPSTVGFATEGSKIITVLATGTGGVKILLPSGYSMQAGTAFATTTGTGGATLTQGQKVQLIPIGTNAYYLQPLNGSITVY